MAFRWFRKDAGGLAAAQSIQSWLPQTQSWLHVQLTHTPGVAHQVVCDRTENLDQFPMPRIAARGLTAQEALDEERKAPDRLPSARRRFVVRHARRAHARLVHSHFGNRGWRDLDAVEELSVAHVVSFYGYDAGYLPKSNPVWQERYRALFARGPLVLAEGPAMAERLIALGSRRGRTRVHALGVDLRRLPFRPASWTRGTPLRVLLAGRYIEKKGFPDGLAALGDLSRSVPVEVTLVGDAADDERSGVEKQRIVDTIAGTGLSVRQPGLLPYDRLLAEARTHHLFLAPSRTASDGDTEGGAPFTILEMAALGLVVAGTRHADIPFVLPPASRPFLAEEGDVPGLAKALHRLVDRAAEWPALAQAQRRHLEAGFDARRQGARLADLYRAEAAASASPGKR
jgi:colanic acid/amylovoran biosynthesis glycosyltransferase